MTSTFTNIPPKVVPVPDPHKYVNYTLGMLLGVDDFLQEHAYLSGHDAWLTRELLGYGTDSGLHVSSDVDGEKGPRVLVDPGVAVSPRGQLIRVTPTQCAYLNDWLAANRQQLGDAPDNPLTVYVVLSYRACATDNVPISGEPCRSEDNAMASSRLSDDFTLELRLAAPDQREEEALRAFIAWLRQVRIADPQTTDKDKFTTPEQFAKAILKAAQSSDPASPSTFMAGSPPTDLLVPADKACEYWQIAFRIWTTELRPQWRALCSNGDVPDEDSVLLARLRMPIIKSPTTGDWQVKPLKTTNPVHVHEDERPRLLHLQLLQEWMLCGRREAPPSDIVSAATLFGLKPDPGMLTSYSRADHSHGTPELKGDVVSNDDGSVTVQGLQNISVDSTQPTDGQVLMYNAEQNKWQPVDLDVDDDEERERDRRERERDEEERERDKRERERDKDERERDKDERERDEDRDTRDGHGEDPGGDVVRDPEGFATVRALRHVPLADTTPAQGHVLMYSGEQWQPTYLSEPPDMVERPRGLGRYAIVAAGYVKCNRTGQETSFNGLTAETFQEGIVRVRFNDYSNERIKQYPYIVKALAGWHDKVKPCIVHFDRFLKDFFVLRVTDGNGNPLSKENLEQLDLMIEVSEYEVLAPAESNGKTGTLSNKQA